MDNIEKKVHFLVKIDSGNQSDNIPLIVTKSKIIKKGRKDVLVVREGDHQW